MKNQFFVLAVGLIFAGTALAQGPKPDEPAKGEGPQCRGGFAAMREGCDDLKLTDEQKTAMKEAHFKFEEEKIDLEAKARHAKLDLEKALNSKDSSDKAIRKAAQAAAEASSNLHAAEELNRTEVLLTVFKGDQREEALRCGFMHHGRGFHDHADHRDKHRPGPRDMADEDQQPSPEAVAASDGSPE